jgi:hypothetical protein
MTRHVPDFVAEELAEVQGFFQLPQHFCPIGLWGQFDNVDVSADQDIGLGPRRVWRTHAQVTVTREHLWDAWARVKFVYRFRSFSSPFWFKTDVAFRTQFFEDLEKQWGKGYLKDDMRESSFCYSGRSPAYSIETRLTGRADWSVAGILGRQFPDLTQGHASKPR